MRRSGRRRSWRWKITQSRNGQLYFHPRDFPVRVWAVDVEPDGLIWSEAEIVSISPKRVNVLHSGGRASLDRERLARSLAWWRGRRFLSARDGLAAKILELWWELQYGRGGSRMPLHEARKILKMPQAYTRDDIIAAYRREAKQVHPDMGGTDEAFRRLIIARDRLLRSIGHRSGVGKADFLGLEVDNQAA
jgi:hypothetical protein